MDDMEEPGPVRATAKRAGGKPHGEQIYKRRLALLSLLQGEHQDGLSARILAERLACNGYPCSKRSVERDLAKIQEEDVWRKSGIAIVSRPAPYDRRVPVWTHKGAKKLTLLHSPSGEDAMLIGLMAQELQAFLPGSALDVLSSYTPASEGVLGMPVHAAHARYRNKIRTLPEGPLAIPPSVAAGHLRTVNEALLREEQLDLHYYAGSHRVDKRYRLHPVGIVKKGLFFWLIAFKEKSGKLVEPIRTFRMDRIRSVGRRENEPVSASLPELQHVLDIGLLGFFPKNLVRLSLRSTPGRAGDELINNYRDTPLSLDQQITLHTQGGYRLEAQVRYTRELVWMLQGQAHLLEVLEPPELRQELQKFAALVANRYGSGDRAPAAPG